MDVQKLSTEEEGTMVQPAATFNANLWKKIISISEKDAGALHEDRHVGSPYVQPPVEGRKAF